MNRLQMSTGSNHGEGSDAVVGEVSCGGREHPMVVAPDNSSSGNPAPSAGAGTRSGPLRLGRGRKQCPNCKTTTKSAVKQCRECRHIFTSASSCSRAPLCEINGNSHEPIPARRKVRPSQRLIESKGPGADEGANRIVDSSSGGVNRQATRPKHSHKRKVPSPSMILRPKRKKGSAAAANPSGSQTANRANKENAHHLLSFISQPERQLVAQHLAATSTPATPAGPLLFLAPNASLDDDSGWLSTSVSMAPFTVQLPQQSVRCRYGQENQRLAPKATNAVSVRDLLISNGKGEKSEPSKRLEDVIDTSAENQAKDPFEGVQLLLEGSSRGDASAAPELSQRNSMDLLGDGEVDFMWSPMRAFVVESIGSLAPINTSL